jgi:hypothetical protein
MSTNVQHQQKNKNRSRQTYRDKVHFLATPEGLAHVQRPPDPEAKEDGDVYVRGEEVLRIPLEEHLVAIEKDEDRRPKDAPDGEPGLQRVPVRELGAIAALCFVSTPCSQIGY